MVFDLHSKDVNNVDIRLITCNCNIPGIVLEEGHTNCATLNHSFSRGKNTPTVISVP